MHIKTKPVFVYPRFDHYLQPPQVFGKPERYYCQPTIIIEVLSPETKNFDYSKKFMHYRQIISLQEYILLSSMDVQAEKIARKLAAPGFLPNTKTLTTAWPSSQ